MTIAPAPISDIASRGRNIAPSTAFSSEGRRAIVFGAGFGGIAAALRLRAHGFNVTLLDRLDQLGGRARVFHRGGYTFDAGPTVITAPFLLDELFQLFGRRLGDEVALVPVDPWYRIQFDDGSTFDYTGSTERTLEEIDKFNPSDRDGYLRMMRMCDEIYRVGFEQLGDQPFDKPSAMLHALPQMLRLRSFRSTWSFVSSHLQDERLRRVFTFQPLLVGGNPFRTSSIYALIQSLERRFGVHYILGGTGALVAALGRLMTDVGIELRLGETVSEIRTRGRRVTGVRLEGGEDLNADLVVSGADPTFVYRRLIPTSAAPARARKSERMKQSMGLFVTYFGTRKTYPDLAHHTILLSDRYKGLLRDVFDGDALPPDPSLYVHAPTRTDPGMAPPDRECFYALAPVPNLRADIDWAREAERFRDVVLGRIESEMAPGLRDSLDVEFHVTPEYFRDELLSVDGAGFGPQPTLGQSAYFRFHNKCPRYEGLYFVGAGTHPGAGVPGVLTTAKTMERVLRREGVV